MSLPMRQDVAALELSDPDGEWVEEALPAPVVSLNPSASPPQLERTGANPERKIQEALRAMLAEPSPSASPPQLERRGEREARTGANPGCKVWVGEVPHEPVRLLGSGLPEVDALLGGGLPRGDVSEVVGPRSSGRTALTYALLAASTRTGEVVAVVDLPDALHPLSLEGQRADLARVLWVRPPTLQTALKSTELILDAGGFAAVLLDLDTPLARRMPAHVWPRLRRDARRSGTALIVLSGRELTGSFAGARIALEQKQVLWQRRVFRGVRAQLTPLRSKRAAMPGGEIRLGDFFHHRGTEARR